MTDEQETPVQQPAPASPPRRNWDSIADKIALVIVAGLMVCAIIFTFTWCVTHVINNQQQVQVIATTQVQTVSPTAIVTPVPTEPTPTLPTTLTFTVLNANSAQYNGATVLDRLFTVQTTTGSVLVLPDYNSWYLIEPGVTYTCIVTGKEPGYSDVYTVNDCAAYPYAQPASQSEQITYYTYGPNGYVENHYEYYYWNKQYWRDDGRTSIQVDASHLPVRASVITAVPPHYRY